MATGQFNGLVQELRRFCILQDSAGLTDGELLESYVCHQDEVAFGALMRRHGPMVWGVCRRVLHNSHDAEDAFQATFLVLVRKAGSIVPREAVGNWLYVVGYRTALDALAAVAKRRAKEGQVRDMHRTESSGDHWADLQPILDEELSRLPDIYRMAIVLCDLEGRTKKDVARQLAVAEGTVASRVARARRMLAGRLTRRGVSLSGGCLAAILTQHGASAAVPVQVMSSTMKAAALFTAGKSAAAAGVVSAHVAGLVERGVKVMLLSKLKVAAVVLVVIGLVSSGAGLFLRASAEQEVPRRPLANADSLVQKTAKTAQTEVAIQEKGNNVSVSGAVLDPDGKPIAGAEITLWWHLGWVSDGFFFDRWHPETDELFKPRPGATSGSDGNFSFTFAKSEVKENPLNIFPKPWLKVQIVAAAKGYGPAWATLDGIGTGKLTLRLAKDDVPITGRVIDLQGHPVVGASVVIERITPIGAPRGPDISLWQNSWLGLAKDVVTDKDGRFSLTGVGRDRMVVLHIEGPTIEHKIVTVETRSVVAGKKRNSADVLVVAGPTKPIVGIIRAKDTGKPLAGVAVYGEEDKHYRRVRAITDQEGRYRLVGLPPSGQYELTAYPTFSQGYIWTRSWVGDNEGLKPITANLELRRGVRVKCRVIDKETRQPVRGDLHYTPISPNPLYLEASGGSIPTREFFRIYAPDSDGIFRFIAYPGLGLVSMVPQGGAIDKYLPAKVTAADAKRGQGDPTLEIMGTGVYRCYRLIEPVAGDEPLSFDIELDPGRKVTGKLIGPDSTPVVGAIAHGLNYNSDNRNQLIIDSSGKEGGHDESQSLNMDDFTVLRLQPKTPRTVCFINKVRKLIGHVVLRGDEKGPITLRLEPWGTLTGRLLDAEGKPLSGVGVGLRYPSLPDPGIRPWDEELKTNRDGRFSVPGLLPGLAHELTLASPKDISLSAGSALKKLSAKAGEVRALGDITVRIMDTTDKQGEK